jgi:hypothetical protein
VFRAFIPERLQVALSSPKLVHAARAPHVLQDHLTAGVGRVDHVPVADIYPDVRDVPLAGTEEQEVARLLVAPTYESPGATLVSGVPGYIYAEAPVYLVSQARAVEAIGARAGSHVGRTAKVQSLPADLPAIWLGFGPDTALSVECHLSGFHPVMTAVGVDHADLARCSSRDRQASSEAHGVIHATNSAVLLQ